jgi:hypothetical protein
VPPKGLGAAKRSKICNLLLLRGNIGKPGGNRGVRARWPRSWFPNGGLTTSTRCPLLALSGHRWPHRILCALRGEEEAFFAYPTCHMSPNDMRTSSRSTEQGARQAFRSSPYGCTRLAAMDLAPLAEVECPALYSYAYPEPLGFYSAADWDHCGERSWRGQTETKLR